MKDVGAGLKHTIMARDFVDRLTADALEAIEKEQMEMWNY